jgi:MFS transporter, OFA family, oxalate/formate antiporter
MVRVIIGMACFLHFCGKHARPSEVFIMALSISESAPASAATTGRRWLQLLLGFIAMMTISSPQYAWTLFVAPFQATTHTAAPQIQITASIVIVLQTFSSPLQGFLVEKFGPRLLIGIGAAMSGAGWIAASTVSTLYELWIAYGLLCGIGTGIVYVGIVGLMVKWFPDRRGFATGIVAAGYGIGSMFVYFPLDAMIKSAGYQQALALFGTIFAVIGVLSALGMRMPTEADTLPSPAVSSSARDVAPATMLGTPVFWLMFLMMTMMSTGGLMIILNFSLFAKDFGVTEVTVFGVASIPLALTIDRITNGLTRPFFGWTSDHIGRENTMALAFLLEAAAVSVMVYFRADAMIFVLLSAVVFFGWGEIFSLFPSTLTDTFGAKNATTNYGFLYIAQGVGSVLGGPVAAYIHDLTGSWLPVFGSIITLDVLTALLALAALKPLRRAYLAKST